MFAQLGNTIFENLKGFSDFNKTTEAVYAQHDLINSKPRLQKTGDGLKELEISMRLQASFCKPRIEADALATSRDTGEVLTLLWGNGKVEGSFIITTITETIEDADKNGEVFSLILAVSLREYVVPDKLQQEQQTAVKKSFATGNKKPVGTAKTNPQTCPQKVSSLVSQIESRAGAVDAAVKSFSLSEKTISTIKSNLNGILSPISSIKSMTDTYGTCIYNNLSIRNAVLELDSAVQDYQTFLNGSPATNKNGAITYNPALQDKTRKLKAAVTSFVTQNITRR